MASSDINTLFQDSQHFIWIGHRAGVSRYNGYTFENLLFAGDKRVGNVYAITLQAAATALFVIDKIRKDQWPPSINARELDSPGVTR